MYVCEELFLFVFSFSAVVHYARDCSCTHLLAMVYRHDMKHMPVGVYYWNLIK